MKETMKKINNTSNTLYEGIVSHTRYKPFTHSFNYRFCYFWFSLNFKNPFESLEGFNPILNYLIM